MKIEKIIMLGILGVILISAIQANSGCCFNPLEGFCSENANETACKNEGGVFSSGKLCASVKDCEKGCCVLGVQTKFETYRTCEILARAGGFNIGESFQMTSEEECSALANAKEKGACVYEGPYDKDCKYGIREECGGKFYASMYCSNPVLGTICNKTEQTICYLDNAHYLDSCGNPDEIKENCSYSDGMICEETEEAHCKSLNCEGMKNGEKICISEDPFKVGTRYFRKYCSNGEIITEGCGDFRAESCVEGECMLNPWQTCLSANKESSVSEEDKKTTFGAKEEDCDAEICTFLPGFGEKSECSAIDNKTLEEKIENTGMCLPQIPGGFKFYPQELSSSTKQGTASESDGEENTQASDICDLGDFEAEATFVELYKLRGELKALDLNPSISIEEARRYCTNEDGNCVYFDECKWNLKNKEDIEPAYQVYFGAVAGMLFGPGIVVGVFLGAAIGSYLEYQEHSKDIKQKHGNIDISETISPAEGLQDYLFARCFGLGDCNVKYTWIDTEGGTDFQIESELISTDRDVDKKVYLGFAKSGIEYKWKYDHKVKLVFDCEPFYAPAGDADCGECGADGLPCSEYRCKALGKGCKYSAPSDSESGYCVSSSDHSPPTITHSLDPNRKLEPYQSIKLKVNTNEISKCRFDVGNSGALYTEMEYDFGDTWAKEHEIIISVPGKESEESEKSEDLLAELGEEKTDSGEYPLITEGGTYEIFVKCEDTAGNANLDSHLIKFEVMDSPDTIPPILFEESFTPLSGSAIKYQTTSKKVSFKMNEPAECKWATKDESFEEMHNEFNCDTAKEEEKEVSGYECSGVLTGVTREIGQESIYYIRCKDQPDLIEKDIYQRNTHDKGIEYKLRPSDKFYFYEILPKGVQTKTSLDTSVEIKATTSGGSDYGKSLCSWRLKGLCVGDTTTGWANFSDEDTSQHTQRTINLSEGDCNVDIKCEDYGENIIENTSNFNVFIDSGAPRVIKSYYSGGSLTVITNEESICRHINDNSIGCNFAWNYPNATQMSGEKTTHTSAWTYDKKYYIKCMDNYNNVNTGCAIVLGTV